MHMGMECWDKTWLGKEEKSIEHYENYESMLKPRVLGTFFLSWGIWLPSNKILLLYCAITTGWVLNDAIHYVRAIFSFFVCTLCVFHLLGLRWYTLNKCHFSVVSSASFLSVDPFKLSIPFLPLSSPVSFFHEQEGFTLLLCHPNWLH